MLQTLVKFVGGTLLGAATGAAIGILLAPKSGTDLQRDIQAYIDEVKAAGRQAEEDRRRELEERFTQAKQFDSSDQFDLAKQFDQISQSGD
jgi:gas vesicle protein